MGPSSGSFDHSRARLPGFSNAPGPLRSIHENYENMNFHERTAAGGKAPARGCRGKWSGTVDSDYKTGNSVQLPGQNQASKDANGGERKNWRKMYRSLTCFHNKAIAKIKNMEAEIRQG